MDLSSLPPETFSLKEHLFRFQYLPDYSKFLLDHKLDEFVTVGIRFCREMNLPLLRPLSKLPEKQLAELSRNSYEELLTALSNNKAENIIERNIKNFLANRLNDKEGNKIIDQGEIAAEDIILGSYIKRKLFSFFLYSYTQNTVIHTLVMSEVDQYTTQEHLMITKAYMLAMKKLGNL